MFIERLVKEPKELQKFIDTIFVEKTNTREYKYNYDVQYLFNRHAFNGKCHLEFVDDLVILSDFSISVNGDENKFLDQWINFLTNKFKDEYSSALSHHKQNETIELSL